MTEPMPKAPAGLIAKLTARRVVSANLNTPPKKFLSEGSRNNDLARIAGFLRGQHGLDGEQLAVALSSLNAVGISPLPEGEVASIARSISNYPAQTRVEYDDGPLAKVLAPFVAETSCRTPATGWLRFDGKRWANDPEGAHAREQIRTRLEQIYQDAVSSGDLEIVKQARGLRTATKIRKVFDLVSTDPKIFRDFGDFDQQESEINLANGTLCLLERSLRTHSPTDCITRLADVEFDPDATCPEFDKFLAAVLPEELRNFVLRLCGYTLLGNPKEQIFTIFHGPGSNGKSTLVDVVASVLGDYSTNVEPSSFIRQKNAGVRDDLARLKGARMVGTSELATGEILDAALVKRMTGGDTITARALYREHFEFRPQFVIFMTTNAMPVIDGGDIALARRLVTVPFNNTISAGQRDPNLPTKIRAEKSGILNRLIEGLAAYQRTGLEIPKQIADEVNKYVASSDLIRGFLDDMCRIGEDETTPARHLYNAYQGWSVSSGTKPLSQPIFKQEVTKRTGIQQRRTNKGQEWPGVGMRPPQL
ncbi:putative DNA primase/helicase [Sulfitobacter brevis]|uniref:Putative DNA primase/helicase n=1 Tax=Sulfitobacter brevis TaxID=74348 RepID=A0A1I2HEF5_9RHOB|nr:phage/plasmid primase, P4 family [Sulfitobacter brevis]SFF27690.1 putative DNA primase/helicase [Sulfitobacter brevis]